MSILSIQTLSKFCVTPLPRFIAERSERTAVSILSIRQSRDIFFAPRRDGDVNFAIALAFFCIFFMVEGSGSPRYHKYSDRRKFGLCFLGRALLSMPIMFHTIGTPRYQVKTKWYYVYTVPGISEGSFATKTKMDHP